MQAISQCPNQFHIAKKNTKQVFNSILPRGSTPRFVVIKGSQALAGATLVSIAACLAYKILKFIGENITLLPTDQKTHKELHQYGGHYLIEPVIGLWVIALTGFVLFIIGASCKGVYDYYSAEHVKWKKKEALDLESCENKKN